MYSGNFIPEKIDFLVEFSRLRENTDILVKLKSHPSDTKFGDVFTSSLRHLYDKFTTSYVNVVNVNPEVLGKTSVGFVFSTVKYIKISCSDVLPDDFNRKGYFVPRRLISYGIFRVLGKNPEVNRSNRR